MVDEQIIEFRLNSLEMAVNEIKNAVKTIAENSNVMVRLEAHHEETREAIGRAFKEIALNRTDYENSCDRVDQRLRSVELQMPILEMTSRWIIGGVIAIVTGVFSTFGILLYALVPIISK